MTTNTLPADQITTTPFGASGASAFVHMNGAKIGEISGDDAGCFAQPAGARHGSYYFANRADAIAACVSYAQRGRWANEI